MNWKSSSSDTRVYDEAIYQYTSIVVLLNELFIFALEL